MTTKKKTGFGGQWVELIKPGKHTDNEGRSHDIDASFLEQVVANFNPEQHEPPAVVGHPQDDAPAYGWVCEVRVGQGGSLEARFCDNDSAFEELVSSGKFKKRSAAFYLDEQTAPGGHAPALRHVGFLGAQPPAVKGLKNIHFAEGDAAAFDINFSEGDISMDDKEVGKVVDGLWEKIKAGLGLGKEKESAPAAGFSEADIRSMVKGAVEEVTAPLNATIAEQQTKIAGLETQIGAQAGKTTRAEIVAFCESLGAAKFPPAFKQMGVVEFMETLAGIDGQKVTVVSFSEEGGKKVEKKTESTPLAFFKDFLQKLGPFVAFGEQFGNLNGVHVGGAESVDPARRNELRAEMGLPPKEDK